MTDNAREKFIDAGDAESEQFEADDEVKIEFAEAQRLASGGEQLKRELREHHSRTPKLSGGDLDADPDATSIRFWSGRQSLGGMSVCYRDAWESMQPQEPGHTFTPENPLMALANWDWPFRRLDYLFVRCG